VPTADHDQGALDVLDASFRLLVTGPSPLAIDGAALGHGLPARLIPLCELRALLLQPSIPMRPATPQRLAAAGRSNREIAKELVVVLDTAKKHVGHSLDKLGAANRTQAVARARELGCSGRVRRRGRAGCRPPRP
jgi:hypothetical protein